jgi:3-oxoacyl-[acyl-carrier protein] reductase
MELGLAGKRALVLGSSSGIGKAIALALVQEGARVAISARNEARLKASQKEIGAAMAIPADLAQTGAADRLVREVIGVWGGIDILVTNTGGPPAGEFSDISIQKWQAGFQSLWLSAVEAIQASLPSMRELKWGRVILITSTAAKESIPALTVSNGLRAGLLGLAKSLSREVAADGITVNAILPGFIQTDRLAELGHSAADIVKDVPAGRIGEPEELASLVVYLASEKASYVTGQAIACDGGRLRGY